VDGQPWFSEKKAQPGKSFWTHDSRNVVSASAGRRSGTLTSLQWEQTAQASAGNWISGIECPSSADLEDLEQDPTRVDYQVFLIVFCEI